MREKKFNFIVIDDSELDCFIAEKMIRHTGKSADIRSFSLGTEALSYIKNQGECLPDLDTIIILDVLMPVMSGFKFVEAFESLPLDVRQKYSILAVTSSMNKNDIEKICSYKSVKNILEKPITSEAVTAIIDKNER